MSSPRAGLFHDRPFASRRQVSALSRKYVASIVHPRAYTATGSRLTTGSLSGSTDRAVTGITDCHPLIVTTSGVLRRRLFHAYLLECRESYAWMKEAAN